MQTVYESIILWITEILTDPKNGFPSINTVIDIEVIPNEASVNNAGLFNSPLPSLEDIHTPILGGQQKHTIFLSLYSRRSFGEFAERLDNEVFFEKFKQAVHDKNLDGIMPKDGRSWLEISINGSIYPAKKAENNQSADYLVPLKLVYIE